MNILLWILFHIVNLSFIVKIIYTFYSYNKEIRKFNGCQCCDELYDLQV